MEALVTLEHELLTFGFGEKSQVNNLPMRIRGVNSSVTGRKPSMDILYDGQLVCKISLQIPGRHNLENALAAAAACLSIGISPKAIETGLFGYSGVGRRFEYKGNFNGADVYDDYAHHPRELGALLDAVATIDSYKRVILAFQPHTYTRTKALFNDFAKELRRADIVFLADIYAARETNEVGISSKDLAAAVPGACAISAFNDLKDEIAKLAKPGDIILTVGAGDIFKVGEDLVR